MFFFENISNGAALKERSKKKFQTTFLLIIVIPLLIHTFAILKYFPISSPLCTTTYNILAEKIFFLDLPHSRD